MRLSLWSKLQFFQIAPVCQHWLTAAWMMFLKKFITQRLSCLCSDLILSVRTQKLRNRVDCMVRTELPDFLLLLSATATDYTYALYNGQNFSFVEERIGPTCCMMLHVHMHVWVELEKNQIKEKFKLNQTGKTKLVNHLSSTDRNFLIRNRNSAFYPPLERLQNPLGF